MIQQFDEPDLTLRAIPEPDLSLLTMFERVIFGNYIRRKYKSEAAKYGKEMKKDIFYNGLKYKLRACEFPAITRLMFFFWIYMFFSPFIGDMLSIHSAIFRYVVVGTGLFLNALFVIFVIFPWSRTQRRLLSNHRDANGIPRDKRTWTEKANTPGRYC